MFKWFENLRSKSTPQKTKQPKSTAIASGARPTDRLIPEHGSVAANYSNLAPPSTTIQEEFNFPEVLTTTAMPVATTLQSPLAAATEPLLASRAAAAGEQNHSSQTASVRNIPGVPAASRAFWEVDEGEDADADAGLVAADPIPSTAATAHQLSSAAAAAQPLLATQDAPASPRTSSPRNASRRHSPSTTSSATLNIRVQSVGDEGVGLDEDAPESPLTAAPSHHPVFAAPLTGAAALGDPLIPPAADVTAPRDVPDEIPDIDTSAAKKSGGWSSSFLLNAALSTFTAITSAGSGLLRMSMIISMVRLFREMSLLDDPVSNFSGPISALAVISAINFFPSYRKENEAMLKAFQKVLSTQTNYLSYCAEQLWKGCQENPIESLVCSMAITTEAMIVSNGISQLYDDPQDQTAITSVAWIVGILNAVQFILSEGPSFWERMRESVSYSGGGYDEYLKAQSTWVRVRDITRVNAIPIFDAIGVSLVAFVDIRDLIVGNDQLSQDPARAHMAVLAASILAMTYGALHYSLYGHAYKKRAANEFGALYAQRARRERGKLEPSIHSKPKPGSCALKYPNLVYILYLQLLLGSTIHAGAMVAATAQTITLITTGTLRDDYFHWSDFTAMAVIMGIPGFIQAITLEGRELLNLYKDIEHPAQPPVDPRDRRGYKLQHLLSDVMRIGAIIGIRFGTQVALINTKTTIETANFEDLVYLYFITSGSTILSWLIVVELFRLTRWHGDGQYSAALYNAAEGKARHEITPHGAAWDRQSYVKMVEEEELQAFYQSRPRLIFQGVLQCILATWVGASVEMGLYKLLKQDGLNPTLALTDAALLASIISGTPSVVMSRIADRVIKAYWFTIPEDELREFNLNEVYALLQQVRASQSAPIPMRARSWKTAPQSSVVEIMEKILPMRHLDEHNGVIENFEYNPQTFLTTVKNDLNRAGDTRKKSLLALAHFEKGRDWALLRIRKQPDASGGLLVEIYSPTNSWAICAEIPQCLQHVPSGTTVTFKHMPCRPVDRESSAPWAVSQMKHFAEMQQFFKYPDLRELRRRGNTTKPAAEDVEDASMQVRR